MYKIGYKTEKGFIIVFCTSFETNNGQWKFVGLDSKVHTCSSEDILDVKEYNNSVYISQEDGRKYLSHIKVYVSSFEESKLVQDKLKEFGFQTYPYVDLYNKPILITSGFYIMYATDISQYLSNTQIDAKDILKLKINNKNEEI